MPTWKLRSPDAFPREFLAGVDACLDAALTGQPEVRFILAKELTPGQARFIADKFRWFRWCLRQYPGHRLHHIEDDFAIQLRTGPLAHKLAITLTVRRKLKAVDLEGAFSGEAHTGFG